MSAASRIPSAPSVRHRTDGRRREHVWKISVKVAGRGKVIVRQRVGYRLQS